MIRLFSENDIRIPEVNRVVLSLLRNKNILVSRKAYYFLKKQDLTIEETKQLKTFEAINKDKL